MSVRRIVPNLQASDPDEARVFYGTLLGLEVVRDHGWILTFAGCAPARPQITVSNQGGSGTPVPVVSIEVDDVDQTYQRARTGGLDIVYPIVDEPWGVRRFFVRDPFGNVVNILSHRAS